MLVELRSLAGCHHKVLPAVNPNHRAKATNLATTRLVAGHATTANI